MDALGAGVMNTLPPCYRCGSQPCTCADGITLYHGDCREVLPLLEKGSVGALLTDPPYSSGGMFRGDRTAATKTKYVQTGTIAKRSGWTGDTMDQHAFFAWASLWMSEVRRIARNGASLMVFTDWRQLPVVTDAIQAAGWIWRGIATWWKPGIRMQRARFSSSAEFIAWGSLGKWLDHDGAPQNVLSCAPPKNKEHIAEKPIRVVRWALEIAPPDAVVLDTFAGSGTTGRACKDLGRKAILIEIEEKYCDIAARRLEQEVLFP